ncbi:uncharacterized protein LOC133491237 [Syngnathoides biaculeatus]|uniref:uncharacterized protein LOC133491237 n=1 Tax=Syngnathoides biaculeatus TaxID=300417 RepID=UPI002ADE6723|nr:uncharacterized protein LOC133491237 [Syngnathoides biaculeatus]
MYCTPHYKQLFKSKGNYNEGFGQKPLKERWNNNIQKESIEKNVFKSSSPEKKVKNSKYSTAQSKFIHQHCDASSAGSGNTKSTSKISVVWPPQTDSVKTSFTVEQELKLMKPSWPPAEDTAQEKEEVGQPIKPGLKMGGILPAEVPNGHQDSVQGSTCLISNMTTKEETALEPSICTASASPEAAGESAGQEVDNSPLDYVLPLDYVVESEVKEENEETRNGFMKNVMEKQEEQNLEDMTVSDRKPNYAAGEKVARGRNEEALQVTLRDEEARNSNINNNNNSGMALDYQVLLQGPTEDEEKGIQSNLSTDVCRTKGVFLADCREDSNWMPTEVLQLAQRDDAFVPVDTKCAEATDSDPDIFVHFPEEKAEGEFLFKKEAAEPKINTSSFLEDIFAGLSTSGSTLLSDMQFDIFDKTARAGPPLSALDDLLDLGEEQRESAEQAGDERREGDSGRDAFLWSCDDNLTVEEQIRRNRCYDDDSDDY